MEGRSGKEGGVTQAGRKKSKIERPTPGDLPGVDLLRRRIRYYARHPRYWNMGIFSPGTSFSRPLGEWHSLQASALSFGATMWVIGQ